MPEAPAPTPMPGGDANLPEGTPPGESALARRARLCPPAESSTPLPQDPSAALGRPTMTFGELRFALVSACKGCHLGPARSTGGFSFLDAYRGSEAIVDGQRVLLPGLYEAAERMATALSSGMMPPSSLREVDPAEYDALGAKLGAWIAAGDL